jgi:ribosomal protein L10
MRNHTKTLVYNKIDSLIINNPYVIITQYSNAHSRYLYQLKNHGQLYVPKNSICRLYIKDRFVKKTLAIHIIEGPILILGVRTNDDISKIFSIIQEFEMKVYGGIFNQVFFDFAEIKTFTKLIRDERINEKVFYSLNYSRQIYSNLLSILCNHVKLLTKIKRVL